MFTIKKVKYVNDKVTIIYHNEGEKHTLESKQPPLPEFTQALKGFESIYAILPLNIKDIQSLTVKGASFKTDEGEYIGVTVSATIEIEEQNRPWNINTPLYDLEEELELSYASETLIAEAKRYIKGERQQMNMFIEDSESEEIQQKNISPVLQN